MGQKGVVKAGWILSLVIFVCLIFLPAGCSSIRSFFSSQSRGEPQADKEARLIKQFLSHIRPRQGNPDSHYLLGRYLVERGRYGEAITEFEKVLAIKPDHIKAYNGIAVCYDNLKQYEKARAYYREAVRLGPDLAFLRNNLGYSFALEGDYNSAIEAYSKAIGLNTTNPLFHNNLAYALSKTGRHTQAAQEYEFAGNTARAGNKRLLAEAKQAIPEEGLQEMDVAEVAAAIVTPVDKKLAIEISNGNGINNMARNVAAYLRAKGYMVARCTNARNFNHSRTEILYQKEARELGSRIAKEIWETADMKEVSRLDRPNLKVKVVVGRDMAGKRRIFEEEKG